MITLHDAALVQAQDEDVEGIAPLTTEESVALATISQNSSRTDTSDTTKVTSVGRPKFITTEIVTTIGTPLVTFTRFILPGSLTSATPTTSVPVIEKLRAFETPAVYTGG